MCGDSKPSGTKNRAASLGSSLGEIARALGVPVSRFFAADTDETISRDGHSPDVVALLNLVRAYLRQASPEARTHFVAQVRAMAETPPR